jgi:enoyl-CoA hydratase/carnithine racemase
MGMRELDGQVMNAWGLFSEYVAASELDGRTRELAEKLAGAPRAAVRGTKASLNLLIARGVHEADLEVAQRLRAQAASSPERKAALERRRAKQ